MRNVAIVVVLVVAIVITAGVVMAQGPRGGANAGRPGMGQPGMGQPGMGGPWSFGPRIAQELNLSQDQIATLKALHADFVEATKATREQLRDKMSELAALWADDQSTAADIKAKAEEIEALRSIIRNTGIDYLVRARNVLTPEQRTKLSELIKNRPGFGGGMGMMMGCQGPGMGGECPVGGPGMGGGMGRRGGK